MTLGYEATTMIIEVLHSSLVSVCCLSTPGSQWAGCSLWFDCSKIAA